MKNKKSSRSVVFFDPYGRPIWDETYDDAGNCRGPHGLWFEPNGYKGERRDKHEYPYAYSEFFLIGNHESVKGCGADYSDRYSGWDAAKFDAAWEGSGKGKGWTRMGFEDCKKFVKAYYGETFEFCGLVEGCNASNGYPYWIIFYNDTSKEEK
jgi:hypothetical protein